MKRQILAVILLVTATLLPTHGIAADSCPTREADQNGYLNKICHYLLENKINVAPGSPERYKIKEIVEIERGGRKIVEVRLDCCHMGDIALIDKTSGEVISFHLGAK